MRRLAPFRIGRLRPASGSAAVGPHTWGGRLGPPKYDVHPLPRGAAAIAAGGTGRELVGRSAAAARERRRRILRRAVGPSRPPPPPGRSPGARSPFAMACAARAVTRRGRAARSAPRGRRGQPGAWRIYVSTSSGPLDDVTRIKCATSSSPIARPSDGSAVAFRDNFQAHDRGRTVLPRAGRCPRRSPSWKSTTTSCSADSPSRRRNRLMAGPGAARAAAGAALTGRALSPGGRWSIGPPGLGRSVNAEALGAHLDRVELLQTTAPPLEAIAGGPGFLEGRRGSS